MTQKRQDFELWSGDHKNITVTVTDANSASVDLSGGSVLWTVANSPESASLLQRSTESGCGISISGCTFTISLSPADTSGLAGNYYHEAQFTDVYGNVSTVTVGNVKINYDLA